jgi:hypothetical protein
MFITAVGVVPGVIDLFMIMSLLIIAPFFYFYTLRRQNHRPKSPYEVEKLDSVKMGLIIKKLKYDISTHVKKTAAIATALRRASGSEIEQLRMNDLISDTDQQIKDIDDDIMFIDKSIGDLPPVPVQQQFATVELTDIKSHV